MYDLIGLHPLQTSIDIGSHRTPDTDYFTGHQTPPTTPHPTLTFIPHHLCVVITLVSIYLLCTLYAAILIGKYQLQALCGNRKYLEVGTCAVTILKH